MKSSLVPARHEYQVGLRVSALQIVWKEAPVAFRKDPPFWTWFIENPLPRRLVIPPD